MRLNIFKLPIVLVIAFGLLMYCVNKIVKYEFLDQQSWLGVIPLVLGVAIILTAATSFRLAKTTLNPVRPETATSLVTTGIFAFSRNPMYVGFLLFVAAFAIYSGNLINFLLLPLFVWLANRLYILPEEQALQQLFTSEYLHYQSAVRRWL